MTQVHLVGGKGGTSLAPDTPSLHAGCRTGTTVVWSKSGRYLVNPSQLQSDPMSFRMLLPLFAVEWKLFQPADMLSKPKFSTLNLSFGLSKIFRTVYLNIQLIFQCVATLNLDAKTCHVQ